MEERRGIGFEAMGKGIHARSRRDDLRHADRQLRIADDDAGQELRMEDDLLHMGLRIGDDAGAANFRTGAGSRRNGDDWGDLRGVRPRPPVTDILEIPDRARLPGHEGDGLAEIET
ncbi:hypothetical protein D3C72_1866920 [compost metagenome]